MKIKTCEVMQFFSYMDTSDINVIVDRIKSLVNLKSYCVIIHDKDRHDDGSIKPPHFHAVLTFSNATTTKIVADTIHVAENFVNKIMTTTKSAQYYLVHRNNPEKYPYDPHDVIASFDYVELLDGVQPKQNRDDIATRISTGEIRRYNLYQFVSVSEYSKNKRFYENAFDYRMQSMRNGVREMTCIFISGPSGSGKSTFARDYCKKSGLSYYVSSCGDYPLDNYMGEDAIILDDLRDSTYKLNDFLKMTDNNIDSMIHARFYNKSIRECKYLFVTSVIDIHDFYKNKFEYDKEPQKQFFRRFATHVVLDHDNISFYTYTEDQFGNGDYKFVTKMKNYVSILYSRAKRNAFVDQTMSLFGVENNMDLVNKSYCVADDIAKTWVEEIDEYEQNKSVVSK